MIKSSEKVKCIRKSFNKRSRKHFYYTMTLLEFIKLKIIGPLVTNLICMSWFRDLFEDLSDVASFQLSRAENIRIPVQECNNKALVRYQNFYFAYFLGWCKIKDCKILKKQGIIIFHIFPEQQS